MNILTFLPEIILFIGVLLILMMDVFFAKKFNNMPRIIFLLAIIFSATSLISVFMGYNSSESAFGGMFISNNFTSFIKIIILIILFLIIFISADFIEQENRISAEFVSLVMTATLGGMLLISSNNLLPIYMALELQSLSLYLLAAIKKDSIKSSEAGIKYFLLGSVASALLLFGISLIYGFTGTIDLIGLNSYYQNNYHQIPPVVYLGFVLVLITMFFKVSAAPFHMWTPDVYEGSSTVVSTLFASLVKFVSIIILIRLYFSMALIWVDMHQITIFVAISSLLVGAFGALWQKNLKRILAYSAIGHIGFILAGLSVGNLEAIKAIITYAIIYSSLALGGFAFLLMLEDESQNQTDVKNDNIYKISAIAGLAKSNPIVAIALSVIMFSMVGIPPLAGFFAKFYILTTIINKGFYTLAIIAVLCSVVSAFYYLRVVKVIYFDNENESQKDISLVLNNGTIVLILMALANLLFLLYSSKISKIISNSL